MNDAATPVVVACGSRQGPSDCVRILITWLREASVQRIASMSFKAD